MITDDLDTNLDASTIALGPISFGNRHISPPPGASAFTSEIDLRPGKNLLVSIQVSFDSSNRRLKWQLTSLDPATQSLPDDPFAGFLPPNRTAPEGEGSVVFTIKPKNNLATGTAIRNRASIVFDVNPPILTPERLNTIDLTNPASSVVPLAAAQSTATFTVNWTGSDVGSGVRDFTIFSSDNGGPFTPWLAQTSQTQAAFPGQPGHRYGFYSVARDLTGNSEAAKASAEATTTVPATQCSSDVTPQFTIVRSGFRMNNATRRFLQAVTITRNNTAQPLSGPFALALDGLSSAASLYNPAGSTACALPAASPFVLLNPGGASWNPGQSITVNLEFVNPTNVGITYMPRVLAGGPNR